MTAIAPPEIGQLAFRRTWRHYQALALEAFEQDRSNGQRRTHIVAPPGSGPQAVVTHCWRRMAGGGCPPLVSMVMLVIRRQVRGLPGE